MYTETLEISKLGESLQVKSRTLDLPLAFRSFESCVHWQLGEEPCPHLKSEPISAPVCTHSSKGSLQSPKSHDRQVAPQRGPLRPTEFFFAKKIISRRTRGRFTYIRKDLCRHTHVSLRKPKRRAHRPKTQKIQSLHPLCEKNPTELSHTKTNADSKRWICCSTCTVERSSDDSGAACTR